MTTLAVRGGYVVSHGHEGVADVLLEDDVVVAVGDGVGRGAAAAVDAAGKLVLPGGVDVHVHLEARDGEVVSCDDITEGTAAALAGGTTTVVAFAEQARGVPLAAALDDWLSRVGARPPHTDLGFHMIVTDFGVPAARADVGRLCDAGVTSLKLFMAYKGESMVDDDTFFQVAQAAAGEGAMVMVHAENGDVIDVLQQQAIAAGHHSLRWHALTRPPLVEAEATARAIALCELAGAPLYVVHVSCPEALAPIAAAAARDRPVWAETCPQYLLVDEAQLEGPRREAAKYMFTPPPRTADARAALWAGIADGTVATVGSDHSPFRLDEKLGDARSFADVHQGAPGIETRMLLLYSEGVRRGRLDLRRMVELACERPAELFGLAPRKGTIAAGSDADLVVLDPEAETVVSAAGHRSHADHSLYEGWRLAGAIETVLRRGVVVVEGGRLLDGAPGGEFIARARAGEPLAARHGAPAA